MKTSTHALLRRGAHKIPQTLTAARLLLALVAFANIASQ